jgi:hypothetical protein
MRMQAVVSLCRKLFFRTLSSVPSPLGSAFTLAFHSEFRSVPGTDEKGCETRL